MNWLEIIRRRMLDHRRRQLSKIPTNATADNVKAIDAIIKNLEFLINREVW